MSLDNETNENEKIDEIVKEISIALFECYQNKISDYKNKYSKSESFFALSLTVLNAFYTASCVTEFKSRGIPMDEVIKYLKVSYEVSNNRILEKMKETN